MTSRDYDEWIDSTIEELERRGFDWGIFAMLVIIANILLKIYRKMN